VTFVIPESLLSLALLAALFDVGFNLFAVWIICFVMFKIIRVCWMLNPLHFKLTFSQYPIYYWILRLVHMLINIVTCPYMSAMPSRVIARLSNVTNETVTIG